MTRKQAQDCGGSGAISVSRCCEVGGAFVANGGSAWDSGVAVVSTIREDVSCVGSLLTLEDGMDLNLPNGYVLRPVKCVP